MASFETWDFKNITHILIDYHPGQKAGHSLCLYLFFLNYQGCLRWSRNLWLFWLQIWGCYCMLVFLHSLLFIAQCSYFLSLSLRKKKNLWQKQHFSLSSLAICTQPPQPSQCLHHTANYPALEKRCECTLERQNHRSFAGCVQRARGWDKWCTKHSVRWKTGCHPPSKGWVGRSGPTPRVAAPLGGSNWQEKVQCPWVGDKKRSIEKTQTAEKHYAEKWCLMVLDGDSNKGAKSEN